MRDTLWFSLALPVCSPGEAAGGVGKREEVWRGFESSGWPGGCAGAAVLCSCAPIAEPGGVGHGRTRELAFSFLLKYRPLLHLFPVRKQRISVSCGDNFNKCKISVSFPALNRHLETDFSQAGVGKRLFKETGNIKVYFLNDNVFDSGDYSST